MTVQECYLCMGADYEEVRQRLQEDARILRFLSSFLKDGTFDLLKKALEEENAEDAFRMVHSLKGISLNLGLSALYHSADLLTEELRGGKITTDAAVVLEQVHRDYQMTVSAIHDLLRE